jgi:hypothetical protein
LGAQWEVTARRRVAHLALAMGVLVALTAPYWTYNLAHFGHLVYSPIQSLRLPVRFGLLPIDGYQATVHYGEPPYTYSVAIRQFGIHGVLRHELDNLRLMAPTVFNRGVLVLLWALTSFVFVRDKRWGLYCPALALVIAPFFDGMYWLPDDRYLYPLFPVLLFLGAIGVRNYIAFERFFIDPPLARRFRRTAVVLLTLTLFGALLQARWGLRSEFAQAQGPSPEWRAAVQHLPPSAIVMSGFPPYVTWWTRRRGVIAPFGTHAELERVLDVYSPDYYLEILRPTTRPDGAPFRPDEIEPISSGGDFRLYRILRGTVGRPVS